MLRHASDVSQNPVVPEDPTFSKAEFPFLAACAYSVAMGSAPVPGKERDFQERCRIFALDSVVLVDERPRAFDGRPGLDIDVQSDAQLVEAVLGGDRASYAILVQRYERAVLGVALGILRDHHAAQNVAQDAFATAFERLGTLRRPGRFAPWILGIARRRAIDLWHERSKRPQRTVSVDCVAARGDGRLDERVEKAFEAIDRLPERQRLVVLYRYCDGLSVREIAEATGSPVGTVSKCLSRALARLRKTLVKESKQ